MTNINDLSLTKVAVAGDWHGDTSYAVRAIKYAVKNNAEAIIHTGDFLAFLPEAKHFVWMLEQTLAKFDIPLFFVDGNHEDFPYLESLELNEDGTKYIHDHVTYLPRGYRWSWTDKTFLALGGATSVDVESRTTYLDWFPQERISVADAYNAVEGGKVDVMITHDVPAGTDVPPFKGTPWILPKHITDAADAHRELLAQIVDEVTPKLIWHGHYHNRYSALRTNFDGSKTQIEGLDCNGFPFDKNIEFMLLSE